MRHTASRRIALRVLSASSHVRGSTPAPVDAARTAVLANLQREIVKTARIIASALTVSKISPTMPASLKAIDWLGEPKKWLEEAKKSILKDSGVKGKSGFVKSHGISAHFESYLLKFGDAFPVISVRAYNPEYEPLMELGLYYGRDSYSAESPQAAYMALVEMCKIIPLYAYCKEVLALFVKTTGAVVTPTVNIVNEKTVSASLEMSLGGSSVGTLTGTVTVGKAPEWTLEWKGQTETSKDLDVLLDMIDEEGDTLQPIFNSPSKRKKLIEDLSKKLGVPFKKIEGTHMLFGGKVSGVKGLVSMHFRLIYDLSLDMWTFSPEVLGIGVKAASLQDPATGSLAPWIGKATSVDEARVMLMSGFGKSLPGDYAPRSVYLQQVVGDYAIVVEGGRSVKAKDVNDIIDHVKDIITFTDRVAE